MFLLISIICVLNLWRARGFLSAVQILIYYLNRDTISPLWYRIEKAKLSNVKNTVAFSILRALTSSVEQKTYYVGVVVVIHAT